MIYIEIEIVQKNKIYDAMCNAKLDFDLHGFIFGSNDNGNSSCFDLQPSSIKTLFQLTITCHPLLIKKITSYYYPNIF